MLLDSGGHMNEEKLFGDSIVTEAFLARFGPTRYLGTPHPLQHVYAFDR